MYLKKIYVIVKNKRLFWVKKDKNKRYVYYFGLFSTILRTLSEKYKIELVASYPLTISMGIYQGISCRSKVN